MTAPQSSEQPALDATPSDPQTWLDAWQALTGDCAYLPLADRTQVELTGADRATLLHNFCTNEVRKLPPLAGCEAFLTTVQGRVLAHAMIFSETEALVVDTVPGEAEKIIEHLDRYLIREDVQLRDRSHERFDLLVAGPNSEARLTALAADPLPEQRLASVLTTIAGKSVWLRRVDLIGPTAFFVCCRKEDLPDLETTLQESGVPRCHGEAVEAARIESGYPAYGRDITDRNLPQEVARDDQAISFIKGCYLGQETVARIDAMGHVNQTLVGVQFAGTPLPPPGTELLAADKPVGHVTSATYSPTLKAPLALAYVRRGSNTVGTPLDSAHGKATVVSLPVRQPE